jgi:hypothetical protein
MNRKQLITLLVLVVVVGGAGLLVYKQQMEGRRSGNVTLGQKLLPDLAVNDVMRIAVKQGTNEVSLEKKDDLWRVRERGGYPANFNEISSFLLKAKDVKVLESEQVGQSQLARLSLAPGSGTNAPVVVDLRGANDKALQTLYLGKKHMRKSTRPSPMAMGETDNGWPDGRYVKVGEKSEKIALVSEPFDNIEPKPEQWLNKDFLHIEKVKSVVLTYQVTTNSWALLKESESGQWKLSDPKPGEELDQSKASGVGNPLSSASFTDVAVNSSPESLGLDKATSLQIETFDNFKYDIKIGSKTNDSYALTLKVNAQLPKERTPGKDEKPEDKTKLDKEFADSQKKLQEKLTKEKAYENWTYLVSSWTLDSVLKERGQLMAEKKEEKKAETGDAKQAEEKDEESETNSVPGKVLESK